jgi:hypothetical protein
MVTAQLSLEWQRAWQQQLLLWEQTHLLPTLLLLFVRLIRCDTDNEKLLNCGLSMLYCCKVTESAQLMMLARCLSCDGMYMRR